jgi:hypothetical protein
MSNLNSRIRTLEDVRRAIEDISEECVSDLRSVGYGQEGQLLRAVVQAAQVARERVLDTSIAMTRYVTYCLEREDQGPVPE